MTRPEPADGVGGAADQLLEVVAQCSLPSGEAPARLEAWRAAGSAATDVVRGDGEVTLRFSRDPDMAAGLAALCLSETACCSHTTFTMVFDAAHIVLHAEAVGTPALLDLLFPA